MAVSLTASEIFNVKEWPDLEIWVWAFWGRSRSLKIVPLVRPYIYDFILVGHCNYSSVYCTTFELFGVEEFVILKSALKVTQGH